MTKFVLTTSAVAVATYGVILHTGAAARREFCIAVTREALEAPKGVTFDDIADATKLAIDYEAMDTAERELVRKQLSYCRQLHVGWSKLGKRNQEAFVGGALPASSAVKLLKAPKADAAPATDAAPEAETGKVSQPSGAEVISPVEMGLRFATYLDTVNLATLTATEAKAIADVFSAVDAFKARVAEGATLKIAA